MCYLNKQPSNLSFFAALITSPTVYYFQNGKLDFKYQMKPPFLIEKVSNIDMLHPTLAYFEQQSSSILETHNIYAFESVQKLVIGLIIQKGCFVRCSGL